MITYIRAIARLMILAIGAIPCLAFAQQGTITGQVSLAGEGGLEGVNVRLVETGRTASTNQYGYYSLLNVPAGTHTVRFSYLGLDNVERSAEVQQGGTVTIDARFYDSEAVIQLDPIEIVASASSEARALNQQRTADSYSNIVAADAFGRFPDQNAAEALGRVPGIAIARDQGEGRYVVIRGVDKNLTSFAIDGMQFAAPKDDERAVLMDIVPSDVLQALEVYKVLSPDQPGEGIGGYVNIRTPSAFDAGRRTMRLQLQGNYSELAGKWGERANATYGDIFMDGALGLMISASYDTREIASDNQEADSWEEVDGQWVTEALEYRNYDLSRERIGANINLEWKPSEAQLLYVRANFNQYEDHEYRDRLVFEFDGDALASTANDLITFDSSLEEIVAESSLKDRTETLSLWGVSLGGENRIDSWTVDYRVSYSFADEDTPDDFEVAFVAEPEDTVWAYTTNSVHPQMRVISGMDFNNPAFYEIDGLEDADQIVEEKDYTGEANVRYDFDAGVPMFVKAGGIYRTREKTNDVTVHTYEDPASGDNLSAFSEHQNYPFGDFPFISHGYGTWFNKNMGEFDEVELDEEASIIEDFVSNEDVTAAYFMAGVTAGAHNLEAGVRMEHTQFETNGWMIDGGDPVERKFEKDYTNWMPGVLYTFRPTDQLIVRAAFTNTIARPLWAQNSAYFLVDDEDLEMGNPDLDPYESMNLDASVEYYMGHLGVLSAAAFYKNIENFIYEQEIEDLEVNGVVYDSVTTYNNGDNGKVWGVELAYNQLFTMLPDPMDGLGFMANLTVTGSHAEYSPNAVDIYEIAMPGQSDIVGNIAVSYEKYGIFLRLAMAYRSSYLDELGGEDRLQDRFVAGYTSYDLSTAYQVTPNWSVYANFINLTNEPLRAYYRDSEYLAQFEEYGMTVQIGTKVSF